MNFIFEFVIFIFRLFFRFLFLGVGGGGCSSCRVRRRGSVWSFRRKVGVFRFVVWWYRFFYYLEVFLGWYGDRRRDISSCVLRNIF